MSDHHASPEYYHGLIKKFKVVGWTLIIGTFLTVGIDYFVEKLEVPLHKAVIFALAVAVIKATCVIAIFMHLWWDSKWKTISLTLVCTLFFFAAMMYLTLISVADVPGQSDSYRILPGQAAPSNPAGK
ncbi:MAG: hypothetical protein EXS24_04640 [Pedosphaera sp.]|nr:hypothetical protein [Pedosphaera sp.]